MNDSKIPDVIPSRGAVAQPLTLAVTRDLTAHDLLRLGDAERSSVPVLKKLRHVHHRQAQLLAQGKKPGEIALIVGCTVQRIVQLQNDPAFIELVTVYQDQIFVAELEAKARIETKLVDVAEAAVDEIAERMEDDAKRQALPVGELRKIAELGLDRTVAPPKNAPPQNTAPPAVTINFGTGLRPALREDASAPTIDVEKE